MFISRKKGRKTVVHTKKERKKERKKLILS